MSIFSIRWPNSTPACPAVFSKAYKFTTTRSIGKIPCSATAASCSALPRMYKRPPCTRGCSVFTRPSSISGNPVSWLMSSTANPASRSTRAVPPVETSSTPRSASTRAKATSPVLSVTLKSARLIVFRVAGIASVLATLCPLGSRRFYAPRSAQIRSRVRRGDKPEDRVNGTGTGGLRIAQPNHWFRGPQSAPKRKIPTAC